MRLRWQSRRLSRTLQSSPVWSQESQPCSVPKEAHWQVSNSLPCLCVLTSGLILICPGSSSCGVFAFLFPCPHALAGVAVSSTALAITAQVARGRVCRRGFALESAAAQICREASAGVSTNVFLRDLVQDQRRIEVIAEGLPALHGAQLAIDTTLVSPLRADGAPHRRCADESGAALEAARRRKVRRYPELSGERGRAKLVVLAGEMGGRFSEEAHSFLRTLARAKVRSILVPMRSRVRQSWLRGWGSMLACAAARAFASSLLDRRGHPGADGDIPTVSDVFGDFCRAPPSVA